ncbi:MAG: rod shape-determining protein MreD [Leeuwenhoekiella sp.]
MTNSILRQVLIFIVLVLAQIAIFSNINFLGYINPYPYLIFVLVFPIFENRSILIISAFLMGLSIDMFENSGGIHAASLLTIAYLRPFVLRSLFGTAYEYNQLKISSTSYAQRFTYVLILVVIHHFILFTLETFALSDIIYILKRTLFTTLFSVVLIFILLILFTPDRK